MATLTTDEIERSIGQLERRIELRRARLARHGEELRATAREKAKPLALAGVAAVAATAFFIGHHPAQRRRFRRAGAPGASRAANATGAVAMLAAVAQGLIAIAAHPLVRSAWRQYTRKRV